MVRGIDNVIDLVRRANMPHWKLYDGLNTKTTNVIVGSGGNQDNSDIEAAIVDITSVLNKLQPGKYLISCRSKYNESAGGNNIAFEIPYANGMVPAISGYGNTAAPIGFVHESKMELELVKVRNEYELKELNRKFEEFTKKKEHKEDAVGKFFTQYGPMIMGVLAQKFGIAPAGTQVGLQGFTDPQAQPTDTGHKSQDTGHKTQDTGQWNADQKMEWVINTLAQKEGSPEAAAELLYRFTHYTIQNPQQYEMFKPMILNTKTE